MRMVHYSASSIVNTKKNNIIQHCHTEERPLIFSVFLLLIIVVHNGSCVRETTDPEQFKALMEQIFKNELGEDLQRKLESISNEGVMLNKTSKEIEAMAMIRLNDEEKKRLKKAFEAVSGTAKKFARPKVKGAPKRKTRSSDFKYIPKRQRNEKLPKEISIMRNNEENAANEYADKKPTLSKNEL